MNEFRNRPIRKFNPGTLQSDEEVIEQFVIRKHEFDIVLDVLRGNVDSPSCQHVLVVAPRGRGKTMLLARVAVELRTASELTSRLFPVRFMEESQEIFDLADFWLETLFHLARESATHDPELAQELRETHAALITRWREPALEEHARAAVLEAADRLGKKLVLMVENLQALCENVNDDFGWKLRGALQSEPQIILLATATSRFEGLDDAQEPFFDLFRIVGLQPLAADECRRLWQVVSGDAVSGREIRPLQILTGGNPRLLVIVAGFAQHRSLRQLMEELVKLIDEHTEYFRSHLEVLAKTERRVYIAVIDLWQASRTGEIAARARMGVRTVSTMLGRLVDRGVVIVEGSGKKRLYAAERLYSIYYKLRRERDEAAVVENLVHFMVAFYSESELAEMSGTLMAEADQSKAIREGIKRAMAELPQVNSVFSSVERLGVEGLSKQTSTIDDEVVERFGGSDTPEVQVPVAWALSKKGDAQRARGEFERAIAVYDEVVERFGGSDAPALQAVVAWVLSKKGDMQSARGEFEAALAAYDEVVERFGGSDVSKLQVPVAWALSKKGDMQSARGEFEAALAVYDEVVEHFGGSDTPEVQVPVAWALSDKGNIQRARGEFEAALAVYDEVVERFGGSDVPKVQVPVASALVDKGDTQRARGEFEAALAVYDEVVERFGGSDAPALQAVVAWAVGKRGDTQRARGEFEAALAVYDEVVEHFGGSDTPEVQVPVAWALSKKGDMQSARGEFEAALAVYDEVVERFGGSDTPEVQVPVAWALVHKGVTQTKIGRAKEALHTCEELEQRLGILPSDERLVFEWRAMCVRTKALLAQEKHRAAMDTFRSAYAMFVSGNETMMREMLRLVPDLIVAGASERDLVEILSSDKAKSNALLPLIVALRQRNGEVVRAPAEVLEVAADIHERIEVITAKGPPVELDRTTVS